MGAASSQIPDGAAGLPASGAQSPPKARDGDVAMGMSDAAIYNYLAEVRKWSKRPTDYDAQTEAIIRRILNGDIQPPYGQVDHDPGSGGTGTGAQSGDVPEHPGGEPAQEDVA